MQLSAEADPIYQTVLIAAEKAFWQAVKSGEPPVLSLGGEYFTPYFQYLRQRIAAFPDLSAVRLTRELRERGYTGAYTAVKRFAATIRPDNAPKPFEVRFETPAGQQAQVDFARFVTIFTDEPGVTRIIWLTWGFVGQDVQFRMPW